MVYLELDEIFGDENSGKIEPNPLKYEVQRVTSLAKFFSNCIIFRKGLLDIISDGSHTFIIGMQGSLKRCGGQGDVLCGTIATFLNYGFRNTDESTKQSALFSDDFNVSRIEGSH